MSLPAAYLAVKDAPPRDPISEPLPATRQEIADEYRAMLVRARRQQLQKTRENLQRLAETYDRAADAIIERIRAVPADVWLSTDRRTEWVQAQLNLLRGIREETERFARDYGGMLNLSMLTTAQEAAEREAELARLIGADADPRLFPDLDRTLTLTNGAEVAVQYSTLARDAVEGVANRYYRDGLKLSDRLYRLQDETRKTVEDTIVQSLADGSSARDTAIRIREAMAADGVQTPRYNAMRIARTELNNAHREAAIRAVTEPNGNLKPYVEGVKWNLSLSHARSGPDVCDLWAAHDEGLGPGVYSPGTTPVDHPHGLCFLTTVLREIKIDVPASMKPEVEKVPRSQVQYYAAQGDSAAMARLSVIGPVEG